MRKIHDELAQHSRAYLAAAVLAVCLAGGLFSLETFDNRATSPAPPGAPVPAAAVQQPVQPTTPSPHMREHRAKPRHHAARSKSRHRPQAKRDAVRRSAPRSPSTITQTVTVQTSAPPAPSAPSTAAQASSTPAASPASAPALSVAQVRAGENGAVAITSECLYETEQKWSADRRILGKVARGVYALTYAAQTDPDTKYRDYTGGPPTTMREMVALIADDATYYEIGGACADNANRMKAVLDGLPN